MSEKLIIVGAPRSGTNILRDVLTTLPGFGTWPCDEINLLWKHGNLDVPHDELRPEHARADVTRYLREAFDRFARRQNLQTLVEKTCATSLRVSFAATVFPEAKFLFIRRDGIDAAASAVQRWNAPLDIGYTLRKARYVPVGDLPAHLGTFAGRQVRRRIRPAATADTAAQQVSTWWGPRPHDHRLLQSKYSLAEVAFIQWMRCVEQARQDLNALPPTQWHEITYEAFVADPEASLRRVLQFLGRPEQMRADAVRQVRGDSVGKGRRQFDAPTLDRLQDLGGPMLEELGYA